MNIKLSIEKTGPNHSSMLTAIFPNAIMALRILAKWNRQGSYNGKTEIFWKYSVIKIEKTTESDYHRDCWNYPVNEWNMS